MANPIMIKRIPCRIGRKRPRIPNPIKNQPMAMIPIRLNSFICPLPGLKEGFTIRDNENQEDPYFLKIRIIIFLYTSNEGRSR